MWAPVLAKGRWGCPGKLTSTLSLPPAVLPLLSGPLVSARWKASSTSICGLISLISKLAFAQQRMLADAACLESKPNHACHQDTELALRVLKKLPEEWRSCVSHMPTYPNHLNPLFPMSAWPSRGMGPSWQPSTNRCGRRLATSIHGPGGMSLAITPTLQAHEISWSQSSEAPALSL